MIELCVIYSLLGRLVIFLIQKSPYSAALGLLVKNAALRKFLNDLFSCDLCLGCWVYPILSWIMGVNIYSFYMPIISEIITGWSVSFVMHLVAIGWKDKFSMIVVG